MGVDYQRLFKERSGGFDICSTRANLKNELDKKEN